jgi:hypothetical protein
VHNLETDVPAARMPETGARQDKAAEQILSGIRAAGTSVSKLCTPFLHLRSSGLVFEVSLESMTTAANSCVDKLGNLNSVPVRGMVFSKTWAAWVLQPFLSRLPVVAGR